MNILKNNVFLLACLLSHFVWSQRIELKTIDPILCVNEGNGDLMIIEDSTEILIYNCKTKKRTTLKIESIDIPFNELKNEFIPIFKGGDLYFVEKGCGRLLKLDEQIIKRIDKSFSHRNQYFGIVTVYNDTIYTVGGYGFFTVKDLVTYYDEDLKTWLMKNHSFRQKHQILNSAICQVKNGFAVVGGRYFEFYKHGSKFDKLNESILSFDTRTGKWSRIGKINVYIKRFFKNPIYNSSSIIVTPEYLNIVNVEENKLRVIRHDYSIQSAFYVNGKVVFHRFSRNLGINQVSFIEIKEIELIAKTGKMTSYTLMESNNFFRTKYFFLGFTLLIIFLFFFLIVIVIKKSRKKNKNVLIPIDIKSLLELWIKADKMAIEFSDLNILVSYDNPELETLKKRRELLLKRFKNYLIEHHGFKENEIYNVQLNVRDRRVKMLILDRLVYQWYHKVKD